MTEAPEAPQGGALSLDEAVAILDQRDDERDGRDEGDEELEGAASVPDEAEDRAEDPSEDEDEEAEADDAGEVDRLEPPKYWSKDAKARFAQLDPDLQAVVLSQEGPREAAAARVKAEAEQVRAAALQEAAQSRQIVAELAEAVPAAVESFALRWGGEPDWGAIAEEHGVEAMGEARAHYEAERAELQHAAQAAAVAERASHEAYVAAEFERLKTLDPELADPETGGRLRTEVAHYLQGEGFDPQNLLAISALEISVARKAMLWDRAQAKARASNSTPRPDRQATRPLARGAASTGPADPQARRAAQAKSRFAKSRSIEDAVALLNAQGD